MKTTRSGFRSPTGPLGPSGTSRWPVRGGFTLVELLVVIAIIATLAAISFPVFQAVREAARRTQCTSNLKNMGSSLHAYDSSNRTIPPGSTALTTTATQGIYFTASGFVLLLPYQEEPTLFRSWDFAKRATEEPNLSLINKYPVPGQTCPSMSLRRINPNTPCSAESTTASSYALSTGSVYRANGPIVDGKKENDGAFVVFGSSWKRVSMASIGAADGTTKTIGIGEMGYTLREYTGGNCYDGGLTQWATGYPGQALASTEGLFNAQRVTTGKEIDAFRGDHPGGVMFVFMDGSAHFLSETIDANTLKALTTRAGNDTPGNY